MLVFGATCQQGSSVVPRSPPARIITLVSFIALMFLYTRFVIKKSFEFKKIIFKYFVSYSANIVALLQSPSTKIQTLKDLLDSR